jgi:hypothetical protein
MDYGKIRGLIQLAPPRNRRGHTERPKTSNCAALQAVVGLRALRLESKAWELCLAAVQTIQRTVA